MSEDKTTDPCPNRGDASKVVTTNKGIECSKCGGEMRKMVVIPDLNLWGCEGCGYRFQMPRIFDDWPPAGQGPSASEELPANEGLQADLGISVSDGLTPGDRVGG